MTAKYSQYMTRNSCLCSSQTSYPK